MSLHPLFQSDCHKYDASDRSIIDSSFRHPNLSMQPSDVEVVVYHFPCPDGFASAMIAWMASPHSEFIPTNHGDFENMGDRLKNRNVIFLDISPTPEQIDSFEMKDYLVLDHHRTSEVSMERIDNRHKVFDMNHSGCVLAHNYFMPGNSIPDLVRFIELRDLWRHQGVEGCEEYLMGLHGLHGYCVKCWVSCVMDFNKSRQCYESGILLLKMRNAQVEQYVQHADSRMWGNIRVWMVNITDRSCISETGNALVSHQNNRNDIALLWNYNSKKKYYHCSLRSLSPVGPDVSTIALRFGGGGHAHAAGFCFKGVSIEDLFTTSDVCLDEVLDYLNTKGVDQLVKDFNIKVHKHDGMMCLNYCQVKSRPKDHPIVRACRQLVVSESFPHRILAHSFKRFFNNGENEADTKTLEENTNTIYNSKEDGSIILVFAKDGKWVVCTRGTFGQLEMFESGKTWREVFFTLVDEETLGDPNKNTNMYVFEMCTSLNRIVTTYPDDRLYLIAVFKYPRNYKELDDGELDVVAASMSITNTKGPVLRPTSSKFHSITDVISDLRNKSADFEGYVAKLRVGSSTYTRVKVKNDAYMTLHRIKSKKVTWKTLVTLFLSGENGDIDIEYEKAFKNLVEDIEKQWITLNLDGLDKKKAIELIKNTSYSRIFFTLWRMDKPVIDNQLLFRYKDYLASIMDKCHPISS